MLMASVVALADLEGMCQIVDATDGVGVSVF